MSILSLFGARTTAAPMPPVRWTDYEEISHAARYDILRSFYANNGLYGVAMRLAYNLGTWEAAMKPIRNPTFRVVEFHTAHLWPGPLAEALPLVREGSGSTKALFAAIQQVWTWSNWAAKKQVAARWLARDGDLFIKIAQPEGAKRVYLQLLDAAYVTAFEADERGYVTYARVDIPQGEPEGETLRQTWHTEIWSKERQSLRVYRHENGPEEPEEKLGPFVSETPFSTWGIDFVPIVWTPFRDIGGDRGEAAIWPAIEKIDEANRQATRLAQMLFRHNNVTWGLEGAGRDSAGRELPPPMIAGETVAAGATRAAELTTIGDEAFFRLPSGWSLKQMVPDLKYADALNILNAMLDEISNDLPELAYDKLQEKGDLSGVAIRRFLSGAIDRVLEARGNAYAALQRADEMALTIGVKAGLFTDIGTYEAGDFTHSFAGPPVVALDAKEEAEIREGDARAAVLIAEYVSRAEFLRVARPDWDEAKIQAVLDEREEETPPALRDVDAEARRAAGVQGEADEAP